MTAPHGRDTEGPAPWPQLLQAVRPSCPNTFKCAKGHSRKLCTGPPARALRPGVAHTAAHAATRGQVAPPPGLEPRGTPPFRAFSASLLSRGPECFPADEGEWRAARPPGEARCPLPAARGAGGSLINPAQGTTGRRPGPPPTKPRTKAATRPTGVITRASNCSLI